MDRGKRLQTPGRSRRPLQRMLVSIAPVCFVGALATDLAYWGTAEMMWADFSAWLLTVGLIVGGLAVLVGIIYFFGKASLRASGPAWLQGATTVFVLALAFVDLLVHSRDAWTSVVPAGLLLSAAVAFALAVSAWISWTTIDRDGVGGGAS